MGTKNKKKYKLLSLLMAFALLVTTCLPMSAMAAGTEGADCVTVSTTAPAEAETVAGAKYELDLSKVFTDSDSHSLSYTLESIKLGDADSKYTQYTQIKGNDLYFTANRAGTYTVNLKATCSDKKSVSYALTMNVTAAEEGTKDQYSYDESNVDSVTVWVTMSNDGVPLMGNDVDGTKLSHLKVTVPYFDLNTYGLGQFYRYHTAEDPKMGHKGDYIDKNIVERPTYLHLLIWLTERYYLGLPEYQCGKGQETSHVIDNTNTTSVKTIFGTEAYSSNGLSAFGLKDGTASATSMLINNLWGHDMNFMYLRNHVYPLMDAGWGATADYILLSENDVLDIALFTDWTFYQRGAFNKFDQEVYTAEPGSDLIFSTLKYDTQSPSDGGAGGFTKIDKLKVGLYDENWQKVEGVEINGADGDYYLAALPEKEGTYYLLGLDPLVGTNNSYQACYSPAVAEVDVKKADPFKGMPFTDLYYMDGDKKVRLTKIEELEGGVTASDGSYYSVKDAKAYTVTIPKEYKDTGLKVCIEVPEGFEVGTATITYDPATGKLDSNSGYLKGTVSGRVLTLDVTSNYIDSEKYSFIEKSWMPEFGLRFVGGNLGDEPENPFEGMPFTDLYYMNGEKKVQLTKIEELEGGVTASDGSYYSVKDAKAYTVTIPKEYKDTGLKVCIEVPEGFDVGTATITYDPATGKLISNSGYLKGTVSGRVLTLDVTSNYIDSEKYSFIEKSWMPEFGLRFVGGNLGDEQENPFEGMMFTDLYYKDGDTKVTLSKVEEAGEKLAINYWYNNYNIPLYTVTVPKKLADTGMKLSITCPEEYDFGCTAGSNKAYTMRYTPSTGTIDDSSSYLKGTVENSTFTIDVTKEYIDGEDYFIVKNGYNPGMAFRLVSGDITPSKPSDNKVTGVTLDKTSLTMQRWTTETLTATVQPEDANVKIVRWSSSDESIVSVEKGVLTSHKAGKADITVTTVQSKKTATCHVTVTDSDKPQDIEGIYQISNAKELLWLANEVNTSVKGTVINATLTQDIDLSGLDGTTRARESWPAIGISTDHPYTGTFDGNGRTVQNLYGDYQATGDKTVYVGLFGVTDKATIKNVTVTGTISAVSDGYNDSVNIGGICGSASSTTIENCHNQVVLNGGTGRLDNVGGIVGELYSGSITSCSNKAAITGRYAAGIASSARGSISGCWNEGTITGKESYMTGGIVAEAGRLNITDCNNIGSVTATGQSTMPYTRVGGICGSVNGSIGKLICQNCYNKGALSATGNGEALYGIGPVSSGTSFGTSNYTNCFYTNTGDAITPVLGVQPISPSEQKDVAAAFSGDSWKDSCPLPVLKGQTETAHEDTDGDGNCDTCGKVMNSTSAYTISAAQNQMINLSDEVTVTLTVGSKNQETTYNAYALKVTYDADLLTFKELTKVDGSTQKVSDDGPGTLTITGYGADCTIGTNNIDLIFVGKATGGAKVKIESANIDKQANANAQDAPAAELTGAIAFVNITNEYPVSFDDALFTGNSTVKAGENYTLTVRDKNYNYTVTATMGGKPVDVTSSNGGIYFYVNNVTGPLVFSAEKGAPKTYTVTVDTTGTGKADLTLSSDTATYNKDYTFTVNKEAGYGYTVSAKAGVYNGVTNKEVSLAEESGAPFTKDGKTYTPCTYKITGTDIVSNFVIKVDKEFDDGQWTQITFTGEGSADVNGGTDQKGLNHKPFQFKLNESTGFEYTVKENGTKLQADEDGNYTIPESRMTGIALTVTVEKKGELTIVAKEYLKLKNSENENGKTMWLITATGAVNAGKTLAYDTNIMCWSAKYNERKGAYAYLVIYDNEIEDQNGQKQAVTKELVESKAKEKIQESSSAKVTIAYDGDVNGTDKLDINDAQLVYNMYNAMYEDFDTVYVKKFLEADMNGDGTVNVSDAAAVVEALANAK